MEDEEHVKSKITFKKRQQYEELFGKPPCKYNANKHYITAPNDVTGCLNLQACDGKNYSNPCTLETSGRECEDYTPLLNFKLIDILIPENSMYTMSSAFFGGAAVMTDNPRVILHKLDRLRKNLYDQE